MALVKLNLSGHENVELKAMGFIYPGSLHVDLGDTELFDKVTEFLNQYVTSGDQVIIATPGLAPLACVIITSIHGLTGTFPSVQTLIRTEEAGFVPGQVIKLQDLRNGVARKTRKELIQL
jgi:hypothetical protein